MFKNFSTKMLALAAALVFWFFVFSFENVLTVFSAAVPLQAFNLGQQLALKGDLPEVKLTLRLQDEASGRSLTAEDFVGYVDVGNLAIGKHTVPVAVTSKRPGVSVASITPAEVAIELQHASEKTVALDVNVLGEPAKGYEVGEITFEPERIAISGAEEDVRATAVIFAELEFDGDETKPFDRTVPLELGGLQSDIQEVRLSVEIREKESRRNVGVRAVITGSLKNAVLKELTVEPAVISVVGEPEAVKELTVLQTRQINVQQLVGGGPVTVPLILPAGISLDEGEKNSVSVSATFEMRNDN